MKKSKENRHKRKYKDVSEEEEDEEEENEDLDNYESDGFLVNDDYVDEESEDIYRRPRYDLNDDNLVEDVELESEIGSSDNEVINQNLTKKKMRLKKHKVGNDEYEHQKNQENKLEIKEKSKQYKDNLKYNRQKFIDDEDENDFIEKNQVDYNQESNKKSYPRKSLAHKIFSRDVNEDEQEIQPKQREINISNILIRDDLAEDYMRPEDVKIVKTDVPERIQLKFNNRVNLEALKQSIEQEADWIVEKLKTSINLSSENQILFKKKIILVLDSYKNHLDDIPYIVTYKRNLYEPELEPKDVWKIFEYDREWNKMFEIKSNLLNAFETIKNVVIDDPKKADIISYRYIENAKSITDLNDVEVYIEFLKEINFNDFQSLNEENAKVLRPNKSSQIQNFRRNRIDQFARKFSFGAFELSSNLEALSRGEEHKMIYPPDPDEIPEKLAEKYITTLFDQELKVMTAGCKFLALELFSFPFIRNYARTVFKSQCSISTDPTQEGKKELDAFHPSFRVKRLKNKPIDSFTNDLFLDILEAEKKGLIQVSVEFDVNYFKDLSDKLNVSYNSNQANIEIDSVQQGWLVMREETLRIFVAEYCIPYFKKEVRNELQEKAENFVINECAMNFSKLLLTGPYKKKKEINSSNIEDLLLKEEEYPTVFSLIYDNAKNEVYSVMLDSSGDIVDSYKFSSLMTKPSKMISKDDKDLRAEDDAKCKQMIQQYKPDLIVIGANDLKCKYLKEHINSLDPEIFQKNDDEGRYWITFGDISIPRIAANSPKVEKMHPSLNYFYRVAVCLGRFKQNPLSEICQLWHEEQNKNFCLSIPLHPLMRCVNQTKLSEALETEAVKVVNLIGLDINKTCEYQHLQSPLQFISGLGPRKAKDLIDKINSSGGLLMRNILITPPSLLNDTVFFNCAGFIRVKKSKNNQIYDIDPLDITRIHPENYQLANKIAKSAMDENFKDSTSEAIKIILKDPRKIQCLDLQEYIRKSQEKGNKFTKYNINFITAEFQNPFKDERPPHKDLTPSEIFHLFLGDTTFRKGQIVFATVLKVDDQHVKCRLSNDLEATVWVKDIFEDDKPEDIKPDESKIMEMKRTFKDGMIIQGRVKSINEHSFKVDLTLRPSELKSAKNYYDVRGTDIYFVINEEEDLNNPAYESEKKKVVNRYHPRAIKHNNFANLNFQKSVDYLREKEMGRFVYRPSSKGSNYLTLSWKFFENTYMHVEIVEEDKAPGKTIGNRLKIGNDYFTSLNEITERYLKPCEMLVRDVMENRKFVKCESSDDFERKFRDDKNLNRLYIQYLFTILPEFPGFIILGYSSKIGAFQKEYIKVKPNGLFFHAEFFPNLDELSNWFKKNYGTDNYREYVKKVKPPQIEDNKKINFVEDNEFEYNSLHNDGISVISAGSNINTYDRERNYESGQKSRDRNTNKFNKTCHNCNEYGHFVSECPNKNSGQHQRDFKRSGIDTKHGKLREDRDFLSNKRQRSPNSEYSGYQRPHRDERSNFNSSNINIEDASIPHNLNNQNFNIKNQESNNSNEVNNTGGWGYNPNDNINTISKPQNISQGFSSGNDVSGWASTNTDLNWSSVQTQSNNTINQENAWSSGFDQNNKNDNHENKHERYDKNNNYRGNNNNSGGRNSRPTGKTCYNCGEDGHLSNSCPNPKKSDNNRGGKSCYICKQEGHLSNNCPNNNRNQLNNNNEAFKRPNTCFNCGESGHKVMNCPKPKNFNRRNDSNYRRDNHHNRNRSNNNEPFDRKISDKAEENNSWGNLQNFENKDKMIIDNDNSGWGDINRENAPNKEESWEIKENENGKEKEKFLDGWS